MPEPTRRGHLAQLLRLIERCQGAGVGTEPLQRVLTAFEGVTPYEGSDGAAWVRVRMGGYIVVDGPFDDADAARLAGETISRRDRTG
ncbi:MAG: hypothetical protein EOP83_08140 [Verrucomicrobiaceae bacterium]|nr:MAG: hypothetical protein EOP83_08140 [Verrucomicrobiaceae bacterium]